MSALYAPLPRALPVSHACALGPWSTDWRAHADALLTGSAPPQPEALLPVVKDAALRRQQKRMSHSAYLATLALGQLLESAPALKADAMNLGYFLGVGASGGQLDQLQELLAYSQRDGEQGGFDERRFGQEGLSACNPLFAFQLMNNFTLCHGAIIHGLGGPNAALYGAGVGTTNALAEAAWSILEAGCAQAVAGGADSAIHPVTAAELGRFHAPLTALTEGVGLLSLCDPAQLHGAPLAWLCAVNIVPQDMMSLARASEDAASITLCYERTSGRWSLEGRLMPHRWPDALAASTSWAWLVALRLFELLPYCQAITVCVLGDEPHWGEARFTRQEALRCA